MITFFAYLVLFIIILYPLKRLFNVSYYTLFCYFAFLLFVYSITLRIKHEGFYHPDIFILKWGLLFSLIILISLSFLSYYLYKHIHSDIKSKEDVLKREEYYKSFLLLLPIFITLIPFLINASGIHIIGSLEEYKTYDVPSAIFVKSGIFVSFFSAMAVLLSNNVIARIIKPIYTRDDVQSLSHFCLYLRSFSKDNNVEEEFFCNAINKTHPVYAVGDPNKVLQPNGAVRFYLTEEEWKDVVSDITNKSNFVLLRVANTEGTNWEIDNVINNQLLKKVIFVVYNPTDYAWLTHKINNSIPAQLPSLNFEEYRTYALFYIDNEAPQFIIIPIKKNIDVVNTIDTYLKCNSNLYEECKEINKLRSNPLRYIFSSKAIPASIRKTYDWGFLCPLVSMRNWGIVLWFIFIGCILLSVFSLIPLLLFCLLIFKYGARINWFSKAWGSPELCIKEMKWETFLLWYSFILSLIFSTIYIELFNKFEYTKNISNFDSNMLGAFLGNF